MAKRAYVGINVGYKKVDYLQSDGNQYINTGFKHNQNTRMVAEIELLGGNAWINIFGSWGNTNDGNRRMMGVQCNTDGMGCVSAYYGNGSYNKWNGVTGKTTFDFNKNVYTIKGTSYTFSTASFQSLYYDYIFTASNYNGEPGTGCAQKLYSFKIYDNGTLIRDYIPVLDSNDIPCLYEKVNKQFYYNEGTGNFTYGNVVSPLEVARQIKAMYVGVNGVARKITKGYVGVNGVAQQFFGNRLIPFTSSPAPTSWSGTSYAANAQFTASNTYGTWTAKVSEKAFENRLGKDAFDNNTNTHYGMYNGPTDCNIYLYLPNNIFIKPTKITFTAKSTKTGTEYIKIYGAKEGESTWTLLGTFDITSSTVVTYNLNVNANYYYKSFRVYMEKGNQIQVFKITSGTLKDAR